MISPFGIEHGYQISKDDKRHTVAGAVGGAAVGAAAASPFVYRSGTEQNVAHHAKVNARRYTRASKFSMKHGNQLAAEGLDASRQFEHAGVADGRVAAYAKEAKVAARSRNKYGALAAGTVLAGSAAGGALGHFVGHKSKTSQ